MDNDNEVLARRIVDRICADLCARDGIGDVWDDIQERDREQIRKKWRQLTEEALEETTDI